MISRRLRVSMVLALVVACGGGGPEPGEPAGDRPESPDPVDRARGSIREVALIESIPWESELAAGVMRRVEVRFDDRVDTIPGIATTRRPVVVGDSIVHGFESEEGEVVRAFRYRPGTGELETVRLPEDFLSFVAFELAPDASHLAYVGRAPDGRLRAVVRTWPGKEVVHESRPVAGYPSGGRNSAVQWTERDGVEIAIRLDDLETPGGKWFRVRGSPAIGSMEADTVAGGP